MSLPRFLKYHQDGGFSDPFAPLFFSLRKFIEDEGEVRFYKNASGKAATVAVFSSDSIADSGVEL